MYNGNQAAHNARLSAYRTFRGQIRRWTIPEYTKGIKFPSYQRQMERIFRDAEYREIVRKVNPVLPPNPPAPLAVGANAAAVQAFNAAQILFQTQLIIYEEVKAQLDTVIKRSFTEDNGGWIDAAGIPDDEGLQLWNHLVSENLGLSADQIIEVKAQFYSEKFRQQHHQAVDEWAYDVRMQADTLTANGHIISTAEKNTVFRKGLKNIELSNSLIQQARSENFENFITSTKTAAMHLTSLSSRSADRILSVTQNDTPEEVPPTKRQKLENPCLFCIENGFGRLKHLESECRHKKQQELTASGAASNVTCHNCRQQGHYASTCPTRGRGGAGRGGGAAGRGTAGRGRGYNFTAMGQAPADLGIYTSDQQYTMDHSSAGQQDPFFQP
jgi:hypothetical protein